MTDFTERIAILSAEEIHDFYGLPRFSQEERRLYFSMDPQEQSLALSHRFLTTSLFFILQLGYFKARRMFFVFSGNEVGEDVQFIMDSHFSGQPLPENLVINRVTRWKQQRRILSLFDYNDFNATWRAKLQEKAHRCIRISSKPINIFRDLLSYLEKSRVVFPAYSTMQKILSKAIIKERARLSALGRQHITRLLEQMEENNKTDIVDRIKKVSPIAWGHINLGGRFKLACQNETINIEQMIARLKESMVRFAS